MGGPNMEWTSMVGMEEVEAAMEGVELVGGVKTPQWLEDQTLPW